MQRICTSLVAVRAGSVMCAVAGLLRMTSAGCSRTMTSWRIAANDELHGSGIPIPGFQACTRRSYDLVGLGHFLSNSSPLQRKQRRSKGPRQPWHRWACVHMHTQLSESVRSITLVAWVSYGIILIIHSQSIPHLTQTKQEISSSHSSRIPHASCGMIQSCPARYHDG